MLDVPYGTQVEGAAWHPAARMHLHVGRRLPAHLEPYAPGPYTLGRFLENTLNPDDPTPDPEPTEALEPRRIQFEAADAIAARAEAGGRQFLLADEPGVGKTISAVLGATAVGDLRGARRVLVVADRPAAITIGHWCRTIEALGNGGLEWVVITWDRLDKVTDHDWDVIIADEAHALRRTTTKRWKLWARISGHGKPHDRAPFVIATTATPGHTPLELPYLAPAYAQVLGEPMKEWTSATKAAEVFATALERHGVGVERGRYGATWTTDPARRAADLKLVRGWLDEERPPAMLHRAGAVGAGADLRHAGRAHAGGAGGVRRRVGRVLPRDGHRPTRPQRRQGSGRAAALPAEGRADPRRLDGRLDRPAGRGRAAGRVLGRVRRDGGRPDRRPAP